MKTISKAVVVGNVRVFACQIQDNLVSCHAQYNVDGTTKNDFKEIIFKTNDLQSAINQYIELELLDNANFRGSR